MGGDGELGFSELGEMLKQMRMGLTPEELSLLFESLDKNDDGNISTKEFVRAIFPKEYHKVFATCLSEDNHAATRWLQVKQLSCRDGDDDASFGCSSEMPTRTSGDQPISATPS